MDPISFFEANWPLIRDNPWPFAHLFWISCAIGWGAKVAWDALRRKADTVGTQERTALFDYPSSGLHGVNILNSHTTRVEAGIEYSLRAKVPQGSKLRARISGMEARFIESMDTPGWGMSLQRVVNWTFDRFVMGRSGAGEQTFIAEEGIADLAIKFVRAGEVTISVFEGDSRSPAWSKSLTVSGERM